MIACGSFCASCKRALRVEPCSCTSLQQSVEHKLGDWADDAIADNLSQLDDNPSAIIIGALLVLLSPALNPQPSPYQMSLLVTVLQWRCPHGVYVFHLGIKRFAFSSRMALCNRVPEGSFLCPEHLQCTGLLPELAH